MAKIWHKMKKSLVQLLYPKIVGFRILSTLSTSMTIINVLKWRSAESEVNTELYKNVDFSLWGTRTTAGFFRRTIFPFLAGYGKVKTQSSGEFHFFFWIFRQIKTFLILFKNFIFENFQWNKCISNIYCYKKRCPVCLWTFLYQFCYNVMFYTKVI